MGLILTFLSLNHLIAYKSLEVIVHVIIVDVQDSNRGSLLKLCDIFSHI